MGLSGDEQYLAWVGWSLIQGKPPTGWSWCPAYESRRERWWGGSYPVVTPFLDHPPLAPVLATVVGQAVCRPATYDRVPGGVPLAALRVFPALIATGALGLLMGLARRWLGT